MNIADVETRPRELTQPGQRCHLLFDIDDYGQAAYTIHRTVNGRPFVATSLKDPGDALALISDQIANEELAHETERLLVRQP